MPYLVSTFFIPGAVAVLVSRVEVMKYVGAGAKTLSYGISVVFEFIFSVCPHTVLHLFMSFWKWAPGR